MPVIVVGIIPIGGGIRDDYPLVQSRCHYNIADVYTVATVVQDYASNSTFSRDVEYVFPLPPSAAVCAFKAVLDDKKTIKGVVKEKKEAKKEYDAAVAQGKTAGLLQQEHADVFRVSLGNIKPKQKISVHISFVSIISHDGSSPQTLRVTMPTAIAPRYGAAPMNIPWFGTNSRNRFELTVAVQMNKSITSVSSPSHPIGLTLGCAQKELTGEFESSKAFVYLSDQAFLDKDIVIVVSAQGMDTPRCTVERWFTSDGAEETTDAYALTLVPKFDLPALPRQEYIFLVDRSGSMGGGRMNAVKTSLQIMLKSLPSRNTTFNIVSFGSSYTSLWPTSRTYSAESVDEASKHVDTFTANYGGTEIRSALEFAFSSRAAHKKTKEEDKIPASVFVLTDGEAWDLEAVIQSVSERVEESKKNDCLLRAFVLGVGDQVSTAMCGGIARAGKGVATFVAEGEKPDTKLMNLLKAARGGVIENLSVDWGVAPEKEEKGKKDVEDDDDDFEVIDEPSAKAAPPAPPINLFDDNAADSSAKEIGPEKTIVNLSPPPLIQQAPKSDQLPIPLYPGFRCSIFAIIKQSSNPGSHLSHVKITGKVLGRDVVLQLPVTPVSIAGEITKDAVEGGRLLHTLAAKALIQDWEDQPSTPETKAQIERLGKRYTLASSVTSFLAIDEESNDELHPAPQAGPDLRQLEVEESLLERLSAKPTGAVSYMTKSKGGRPPPPSIPQRASNSSTPGGFGSAPRPMTVNAMMIPTTMAPPLPAPSAPGGYASPAFSAPPPPPPMMAPPPPMDLRAQINETADLMRQNLSLVAERGERLDALQDKTSSLSSSSQAFKKAAAPSPSRGGAMGGFLGRLSSASSSRRREAEKGSAPAPAVGAQAPFTVESLARAQNFDGSFPSTQQFLQLVMQGKTSPAQPSELSSLGGDQSVKESIWTTILTLACLQKSFSGDKDTWEMLAEKANDFVDGALQDLGVASESIQKMITDLKTAALASF